MIYARRKTLAKSLALSTRTRGLAALEQLIFQEAGRDHEEKQSPDLKTNRVTANLNLDTRHRKPFHIDLSATRSYKVAYSHQYSPHERWGCTESSGFPQPSVGVVGPACTVSPVTRRVEQRWPTGASTLASRAPRRAGRGRFTLLNCEELKPPLARDHERHKQ
jgi:hypothetical protein